MAAGHVAREAVSSQITWLTPRQSARTLSMPARSSPGLRFGSSTEGAHHCGALAVDVHRAALETTAR